MANEKKREELKVVIVEFRVSMHCNACERTIVETFTTEKLLQKLKMKTRKKVEIAANKREEEGSKDTGENVASEAIPQPINGHCPPIFNDCCENKDL
ncbi:heavy metal-associated isoprenylated plant protein 19-like [Populus alba x Populus x berolinensis]|nr:heavy metal-associated isoprenylated plant protein 19-like [Populus alba x Populus x berolinensis]